MSTKRAPLGQTEPRLEAELREADNVMAAEARPTEDPSPTSDVDADEVTLGTYGDRPLEVRPGVVAPFPYYIIIDGGDSHCQPSSDRYEAAQAFQEWYGAYGAEHHMRAGSIARCFPQIPGAAHPADRARRMVEDLRRQGAQLKP